jgi:hypothetical protein
LGAHNEGKVDRTLTFCFAASHRVCVLGVGVFLASAVSDRLVAGVSSFCFALLRDAFSRI